jgi:Tfp pilus assembly PilM family ATPase
MSALATIRQKLTPAASSARVGPIGLDCALSEMHLVQLQADSEGVLSVRALASIPYPESREALFSSAKTMRALVRQALQAGNFKGNRIVTTLPADNLQIMPVSYYSGGSETDEAALLALLEERLEGDLGNYVIDYIPVRKEQNSSERQAIVAVARREFVIDYLEALRKCGLEAMHLEIGPSAIRRLLSAMNSQKAHETVLAINFGRTASYLTVISGSRLLFDQEIRIGEMQLLEEVATSLEMPVESVRQLISGHSLDPGAVNHKATTEYLDVDIAGTLQEIVKPAFLKLAEEINRTLIYTASQTRGEPVSRIYLLGSLARWQGSDALLNSLVQLEVETIPNPLQPFNRKQPAEGHIGNPSPEIAVATGLAMHGMIDNV